MTTGRINQVTIVRRGWPPTPERGRDKLLDSVPRDAPLEAPVAFASVAAGGDLLSPSSFPRASVHRTAREGSVAWAPREEDRSRAASAIAASAARGFPPLLRFRTSQWPAIHRNPHDADGRPPAPPLPRYAVPGGQLHGGRHTL